MSSDLSPAIRSFQRAAWKLSRQRRTLRWRRHQPVGHHFPAIESQQRLTPFGPAIWLPRLRPPATPAAVGEAAGPAPSAS